MNNDKNRLDSKHHDPGDFCKITNCRDSQLTCVSERGEFSGPGKLWSIDTSLDGLLDYHFGVVNLLLENLDMEKAKKLIPSFRMFVIFGEDLPPIRVALVQCCLKQARGVEGCVVRLQFVKIFDANPIVTDTE